MLCIYLGLSLLESNPIVSWSASARVLYTLLCIFPQTVYYCGKGCQVAHWKKGGHKIKCLFQQQKKKKATGSS
jgi:hypothetical protein